MEKQMKPSLVKARTNILKLVMVCFLTANIFGFAQAQKSSNPVTPEIKYIGTVDDKLVFQIDFQNNSQESFSLEIKDEQGYQFYFGRYKDKTFKKKFAIDKAELGNNTITFSVATQGAIKQQVFDVNSSFRVVEEVSVVKL